MFSEALRILDRNTAELMVDRMKDEIDELKVQAEENRARLEEKDSQLEEKDAEIARLKKLLEKQNKQLGIIIIDAVIMKCGGCIF